MQEVQLPHLSTKEIGQRAYHEPLVDSTQDQLRKLVKEKVPHGTILFADIQRRGRGRYGHRWEEIPGEQLFFSTYLALRTNPSQLAILNLIAAASLTAALDELGLPEVKIKWPNDVLVERKKIAGVLSEVISMDSRSGVDVLMGIGMNLKGKREDLPEEIRGLATTLEIHGVSINRLEFLSNILAGFECRLEECLTQGPRSVQEFFAERWAYHGQDIEIHQKEGILRGRAAQIDEKGALLLNTHDDRTIAVVTGDLRLAVS